MDIGGHQILSGQFGEQSSDFAANTRTTDWTSIS